MRYDVVHWVYRAEDRGKRRTVVNTVVRISVPQNTEISLTSSETIIILISQFSYNISEAPYIWITDCDFREQLFVFNCVNEQRVLGD
jgi:hypothetical protein